MYPVTEHVHSNRSDFKVWSPDPSFATPIPVAGHGMGLGNQARISHEVILMFSGDVFLNYSIT